MIGALRSQLPGNRFRTSGLDVWARMAEWVAQEGHTAKELASLAGLVFAAWYANVHRAKALDPNRPLVGRRRALKAREAWVRAFHTSLTNDRLMAQVWGHQEFNLPYGAKAKGGKFV